MRQFVMLALVIFKDYLQFQPSYQLKKNKNIVGFEFRAPWLKHKALSTEPLSLSVYMSVLDRFC